MSEDLETVEDLDVDLSAEIPCTTVTEDCEQAAVWLVQNTCCTKTDTICDEHLHKWLIRDTQLKAKSPTGELRCCICGVHPAPDPIWRKL